MPTPEPVYCIICEPQTPWKDARSLQAHKLGKHRLGRDKPKAEDPVPHKSATNPIDRMSKAELLDLVRALVKEPLEAEVATPPTVITQVLGAKKYVPEAPRVEGEPALIDKKEREAAAVAQRVLPASVPPAGELQPGEYVVIGTDKQGNTSFVKVGHTREWIESHYPSVEFEPYFNKRVTVNGVTWMIKAGEMNRVPSIVRDIYTNWQKNVENENRRYPLLSPAEDWNVTRGAMEGGMAWSRVFKTGAGFSPDDGPPVVVPAAGEPQA